MKTSSFAFEAIGTHWQIDIPQNDNKEELKPLIDETLATVEEFDKAYSRFRDDSLITKMAHKKGKYLLPDNAEQLLNLYYNLYQKTDHAFTPLIGQVLVDAGYDAIYSFKPKKLYHPPIWEEVMEYKKPIITMKKPALLDFGAAGKGYIIDIVTRILQKQKIPYFIIDAGGDMYYHNTKKELLRVGLENPDNPEQVIGVANIRNQSICASAGNRRKWKEFHHIMNPHTLTSTHTIKATWVIAKTALIADAIATCLFFIPAKKLQQEFKFSYTLIDENNQLEASKDFPGEFFIKE
jgi:thiamine biosynthesis lipoprotein